MKPQLHDLYHRHIGMAFDRQLRLADLCRERGIDASWGYTVSTAQLTLGGQLVYSAPLLGSHAENNNSWLWAWNNRHLALPENGGELIDRVRSLATTTGCEVFAAEGGVSCEEVFGEELSEHSAHAIGAIVCGVLGMDAYYTIPYSGGRGVAVFQEPDLYGYGPPPLLAITSRFSQLISALPVPDHKAAFVGYATDLGLALEHSGSAVRGSLTEGSVWAEFDHLNRLTELKSTLNPRP